MSSSPCLGIRRENKNRWERRAPLAPSHVAQLVSKGIKVIVQPSTLRTYPDKAYQDAGATIDEDLGPANTIIGVKEVPIPLLNPGKTYIFFSHTIKAQPYNMSMLDEILKNNIRLIDYERITDSSGRRLVRFGRFAGYAGMIDMLHALGDRLLAKGFSTPFLHLGYSYCYSCLDNAKDAVKRMGEEIAQVGLPKSISPMTFAFTSEGAVAQGALEIFQLLPHRMVSPSEMVDLVQGKVRADPYLLYGCVVTAKDMVTHTDPSKPFDKQEYYSSPERYRSTFCERLAPYISVIINCMYWETRFPRLITIQQMADLDERGAHRLLGVADISADIQGSLEFLMKATSIDQPLFVYDPRTSDIYESTTDKDYMYRHGIMFLAVDNLPTEFPREATQWFGDHLLPFMEQIVKSDPALPYASMDLPPEIVRSVITAHGTLTPPFEYIAKLREAYERTIQRILVLGAAPSAAAAINQLSRNPRNRRLTLADDDIERAQRLADRVDPTTILETVQLDVTDAAALDAAMAGHTLVVFLLPSHHLGQVEQACLRNKVHLVTQSYAGSSGLELSQAAVDAGVTFLYEVGLDPGIDHLEAMSVIGEIHRKGGKIRSLVSWCGGIPSPENSDNGIGYKLSWAPSEMFASSVADAQYKQDGKVVSVSGTSIFNHRQEVTIFPALQLAGVPNRDSLPYAKLYGIEDTAHTIFRGSLRYKGWFQIMQAIVEIGLGEHHEVVPFLQPGAPRISWDEALRRLLIPSLNSNDSKDEISTAELLTNRLATVRGHPNKGYDHRDIQLIIESFHRLGLFDKTERVAQKGTFMDAFCELLSRKLIYSVGERDMILMHHIFDVEWPTGEMEMHTSTLIAYGDPLREHIVQNTERDGLLSPLPFSAPRTPTVPGEWAAGGGIDLAMSKLCGLPIAIAAECVLSGVINQRGVQRPTIPAIVKPLLKALNNEGIKFTRKTFKSPRLGLPMVEVYKK
eukprot:TRINITY_DN5577_c0_g1_i1.p1 TRINITY_DN5577_c0_g1~~TRINITY_DN5577_c0_g1_i1.p1  ORF type:complete len:984 (+),score=240.38 TRINITY_DN5577_c0_g1_i1:48-2954(+)